MKIVHLSTGHLGGAGLAARRLNAGLRESGINSTFFALQHPSYKIESGEYEIGRSFSQRVISGALASASRGLSKGSLVTPLSSRVIGRDFFSETQNSPNTVFHIHNWFNLFNQSQLEELSHEFKIVCTLHDQRLFTSASHYSLGCTKFKSVCKNCPQLPKGFEYTVKNFSNNKLDFSKIAFVTPSSWLMGLAESSQLLKNSKGAIIPNSFFGYKSRVVPKIKTSTIKVGFAAMDPTSWIKGGDIVSDFMARNLNSGEYEFLTLSDFENYEKFWSLIDVLLVPSRADNSPNVIHEAKLWGIPVISSNVGGIPEILDNNFDLCLPIDEFSSERINREMTNVIKNLTDLKLREEIASNHRFYLSNSLDKHLSFYESLFQNQGFQR